MAVTGSPGRRCGLQRGFSVAMVLVARAAVPVAITATPRSVLADARAPTLRVLAPVSLREALDRALATWVSSRGAAAPTVVYGATPALVRQLQQGLTADLIITADEAWMDRLQDDGRLVAATRRVLARNRLVLIAPAASAHPAARANLRDLEPALRDLLAQGRLAVADLQSVPAGRYAAQALRWAGWDQLTEGRLAQTEHVRSALRLVARGDAPLGIVYATDALPEPRVRVVHVFANEAHAPIVIPVAMLKGELDQTRPEHARRRQATASLLDWLVQGKGREAFIQSGFIAP